MNNLIPILHQAIFKCVVLSVPNMRHGARQIFYSSKQSRKRISIDGMKICAIIDASKILRLLMDKYVPPYDITEEMLELTAEITEDLGKLSNVNDLEKLMRLRL